MQSSSDPSATSVSPVVPPVIDYEGSPYRTAFWEGQGRDYEDAAERLALQRLIPAAGDASLRLARDLGVWLICIWVMTRSFSLIIV